MTTSGLFITGTDTGVGKTYVTALAARAALRQGRSVGVYKPVCSGAVHEPGSTLVWNDIRVLDEAIQFRHDSERICPQRFAAPLAPPVAARAEGRSVDPKLLRDGAHWWEGKVELLLVEGVGGLLCPLTTDETVADLARDLGYPLLIVARLGLGTINHTLLTVDAAERRNLPIAGIILNETQPYDGDSAVESNEQQITQRCGVPILGVLRHGTDKCVRRGEPSNIDWLELARAAGSMS